MKRNSDLAYARTRNRPDISPVINATAIVEAELLTRTGGRIELLTDEMIAEVYASVTIEEVCLPPDPERDVEGRLDEPPLGPIEVDGRFPRYGSDPASLAEQTRAILRRSSQEFDAILERSQPTSDDHHRN